MKNIIIPFLIIFAGLVSCEKYPDKGSYENPILKLYGDAYNDVGASIALTSTGYALCGRLEVITRSDNGTGNQFIESSDNDFGVIIPDDRIDNDWVGAVICIDATSMN